MPKENSELTFEEHKTRRIDLTKIKENSVTPKQYFSEQIIMSEPIKVECKCSKEESCPICKDEKIAAGQGAKFDTGKLRFSLVPPIAIESIADILTFGAKKYAKNSWQNVTNGEERYLDALMRHLEAYRAGEEFDEESGKSHLSHLLCNAAFIRYFQNKRLSS